MVDWEWAWPASGGCRERYFALNCGQHTWRRESDRHRRASPVTGARYSRDPSVYATQCAPCLTHLMAVTCASYSASLCHQTASFMMWRVCGTSRGVGRPRAQQGLRPSHVEPGKWKSGAAYPSGLVVRRLSAAGQGLGAGDQGTCGQPAALAATLKHAGHDLPSTVYALRLGPLPRLDKHQDRCKWAVACA